MILLIVILMAAFFLAPFIFYVGDKYYSFVAEKLGQKDLNRLAKQKKLIEESAAKYLALKEQFYDLQNSDSAKEIRNLTARWNETLVDRDALIIQMAELKEGFQKDYLNWQIGLAQHRKEIFYLQEKLAKYEEGLSEEPARNDDE